MERNNSLVKKRVRIVNNEKTRNIFDNKIPTNVFLIVDEYVDNYGDYQNIQSLLKLVLIDTSLEGYQKPIILDINDIMLDYNDYMLYQNDYS